MCSGLKDFSTDLLLSHRDLTGEHLKCVRVDDVVTGARLIYYGKRLLDLLKKTVPVEVP